MEKTEGTNAFENGSHLKVYMKLAMPVVIGMVVTIIYSIVDTYFVAQTRNTMMIAGVSLCAPIFTILMAFGNIFGQGGSSLIARLFGCGNVEDTRRVSAFCFYGALVTGLVIGAALLLFADPFLAMLGATAETIDYAKPYYLIMAAGAPFLVANFVHTNLIRAEGMAKESMIGSIAGVAVNIALDPVMISVLGMGAAGAALASVIGYIVTDLIMMIIVKRKSRILTLSPRSMKLRGQYLWQITGVGISAAVTNWMSSICVIITNRFLLECCKDGMADSAIAAMGVCQKVSMIVLLVATGMVFGGAPMIGYFYGGRRFSELKRILRMILLTVTAVTVVISMAVFTFAGPAVGIFLKEQALIEASAVMLRWQVVTMFIAVFIMLATVCFQASGLAVPALVVSLLRQGVVFIAVITLAAQWFGYDGILCAQAITDVITLVITAAIFYFTFYGRLKDETPMKEGN